MTPALKKLLDACGLEASSVHRRQRMKDLCADLAGLCQTVTSVQQVWQEGVKVAAIAREILPPSEAQHFYKLATLKEDVGHLNCIELGAHIYHIAGERA